MLFLGPTGVGKTQLARTLAQSWFGSEKALLRFDMSEYMEQHTVARLIGAPPGYVGHDEGGQLTEAVRRRPYSVVLFDEIEKAHSDIQNILLQILEDGTLTDAQGRKADFSNTIILLTSNLGARFLAGQSAPLGFAAGSEAVFEKQSAQAIEEAKKWFRPELVGRLDELIVFRPLAEDSLCAIAEKLLGQGDMLFMPVGAPKPVRIQGTFVRDEEISRVLDFIKQSGTVQYDEAMIEAMEKHAIQDGKKGSGGADSDEDPDTDPMFKQAVEVVIDAGQASTSLLQRRCKLGYARAARIMDEMEQKGIIGPYEGAKPRAVLISRQQWLEMQMNQPEE